MLEELVGTHTERVERVARYTDAIEVAAQRPEYAPYVAALSVLRGIDTVSAMTILAELGDLRRFTTAHQLMAAVGLVPGEHSTGDKTVRLGWHYQRRATSGRAVTRRRKGQAAELLDIVRPCDLRLNRKFHRMTSRGKRSTVAAVAVARELMGFIWAIGQLVHP